MANNRKEREMRDRAEQRYYAAWAEWQQIAIALGGAEARKIGKRVSKRS